MLWGLAGRGHSAGHIGVLGVCQNEFATRRVRENFRQLRIKCFLHEIILIQTFDYSRHGQAPTLFKVSHHIQFHWLGAARQSFATHDLDRSRAPFQLDAGHQKTATKYKNTEKQGYRLHDHS